MHKHLKALKMFPMSWPENGGWKEVGDDRRWCSLVGMVLGWLTNNEGEERERERSGFREEEEKKCLKMTVKSENEIQTSF